MALHVCKPTVSLVKEHLDRHGRLVVPVRHWDDVSPVRPGWKPWWVNVNLDRIPVRFVTYKREDTA